MVTSHSVGHGQVGVGGGVDVSQAFSACGERGRGGDDDGVGFWC